MRAERRVGQLLIEMKERGEREGKGGNQYKEAKSRGVTLALPKLSDLGVTQQAIEPLARVTRDSMTSNLRLSSRGWSPKASLQIDTGTSNLLCSARRESARQRINRGQNGHDD